MGNAVGQKKASKGDLRISQGRSPAYPYIPLEKALERADQVRAAGAARQAMAPETFYQIWKLGAQSSGARQTMAALNHFSLVDYIARGNDRKVKLSDMALSIVLDKQPTSPERAKAIAQAALAPAVHRDLYEKYGAFLPADVVVETYLVRDRGYNQDAARALIDEYKDTLNFSGLSEPVKKPVVDGSPTEQTSPAQIVVGDMVQVEIDGVLQLAQPARVRAIQDHQGQMWAFIEGSETGVPMEQVVLVSKGKDPSDTPPTPPILSAPKLDVPISGSEREWLRGPLSKETSYRLIVVGDLGPKEIGKLIRLLKAQQAVLSDDEEEDE